MAQRTIAGIVERKLRGVDCTEHESARIKAYFDTHHPDRAGKTVADLFLTEAEEWFAERERGDRLVPHSILSRIANRMLG